MWNKSLLGEVVTRLQRSAEEGHFVPQRWIDDIDDSGGGCTARGCFWGLVGWHIAMVMGGPAYARWMLPVGSGQTAVNRVLKSAGLTREDIIAMTPQEVWEKFDAELWVSYHNSHRDRDTYIETSKRLARYCTTVLLRVPVSDEVEQLQPARTAQPDFLSWLDIPVLTAPGAPSADAETKEDWEVPQAA